MLLNNSAQVSRETYELLSPWIRHISLLIVVLHCLFFVGNFYASESESLYARICAIAAALPYAFRLNLNSKLGYLFRSLLVPALTITGPIFLLFGFLLELYQAEPDAIVVIRRQYELLVALFLLILSTTRVSTAFLSFFCFGTPITIGFVLTGDLNLGVLNDTWVAMLSIYLMFYIGVVLIARRQADRSSSQTATMNTIGSSLAHELRTPILIIKTRAQAILRQADDSFKESPDIHAIIQEVDSASTLIDIFLVNASPTNSTLPSSVFRLIEPVEEAVRRFPYRSEQEKRAVSLRCESSRKLKGERELLVHVVFNLLKNALNNVDLAKSSKIEISLRDTSDGSCELLFLDNGIGISAENLDRIFDNFYSTKQSINAGVGLSFCKHTIEKKFGGSITCNSTEFKYTLFTIRFPPEKH